MQGAGLGATSVFGSFTQQGLSPDPATADLVPASPVESFGEEAQAGPDSSELPMKAVSTVQFNLELQKTSASVSKRGEAAGEGGGEDALGAALANQPLQVDLSATLPIMESRKSIRRYHGAYRQSRPLLTLCLFLTLIFLTLLDSFGWDGATSSLTLTLQLHLGATPAQKVFNVLMWVVAFALVFLLVTSTLQYHMTANFYITLLFVVVQLIVTAARPSGRSWVQQVVALGIYLAVQLLAALVYIASWHLIPSLQQRLWLMHTLEMRPRADAAAPTLKRSQTLFRPSVVLSGGKQASCHYEYVGQVSRFLPEFIKRRRRWELSYAGEVDDRGRPHGYGEWTDSYWHGEQLRGSWAAGAPQGPFKSRETGSGSGFVNVRVGYFQNRPEAPTAAALRPRPAPRTCGVASVECSVSGAFFRDYPRVEHLMGPLQCDQPEAGKDIEKGVPDLLTANLQRVAAELTGLRYAGAGSDAVVVSASSDSPALAVSGHTRPSGHSREHVVVRLVEQPVALHRQGPKADSGPQDRAIHQPQRAQFQVQVDGWTPLANEANAEALIFVHGFNCPLHYGLRALAQLLTLGNFPSYLRPFVFSFPSGTMLSFLAAQSEGCEAEATQQAFADMLRGLAAVGFRAVHILTHSMGVRVLTAALPLLEQLLDVDPDISADSHLRQRSSSKIARLKLATVTLMSPEFPLAPFKGGVAQRLRALCPLVTMYGDTRDLALYGAELFNGARDLFSRAGADKQVGRGCCRLPFHPQPSAGKRIYSITEDDGTPIDIDVIDTTFLQANFQDARHFAFNLNSSMIEDVRELITTRRRAHQRMGWLEARGGNVYSFLVAPTYVVNG